MKTATLRKLAAFIGSGNTAGASLFIDIALEGETGKHWHRDLRKLQDTLFDDTPRFKILAESGNSKLPFLSFSVLPGVTCPGAGECLDFCYSYKAWRYPAAFCRQAQNTLLLQTAAGRNQIRKAFSKLEDKAQAKGVSVDFRLYVDGDFGSVDDVAFWFDFLAVNPWLNAYGYSKSFDELLTYSSNDRKLPINYTLNVSSGHRHSLAAVSAVKALSITRGDFIAVQLDAKYSNADYGTAAYNKDLRETYKAQTGRKAFPCTGKCGECRIVKGENSHACGDTTLQGLDIIIAVH